MGKNKLSFFLLFAEFQVELMHTWKQMHTLSVYSCFLDFTFKARLHLASMIDLEFQRQCLHHIWSIRVATHVLSILLGYFLKKSNKFNQSDISSVTEQRRDDHPVAHLIDQQIV